VFPTRVGMDRARWSWLLPRGCVPHARGDGPSAAHSAISLSWCSPRAWGWTAGSVRPARARHVFPTRVGIDRNLNTFSLPTYCVPHPGGDGPRAGHHGDALRTVEGRMPVTAWEVFPTRVGTDRHEHRRGRGRPGVPHTRGDGPLAASSWRWREGVPHARGDGPMMSGSKVWSSPCSPSAWGWTVPSGGIDQARGGWTAGMPRHTARLNVFTTRVGMDGSRGATP